uniref:Uncharacterized protein n=1 Tax=Anguilla anguilla TaxID=7936 RepID=A0A0E9QIB3_ANGAN
MQAQTHAQIHTYMRTHMHTQALLPQETMGYGMLPLPQPPLEIHQMEPSDLPCRRSRRSSYVCNS